MEQSNKNCHIILKKYTQHQFYKHLKYTIKWLSMLWCCWLGSRRGMQPLSLASVKSRLVSPLWYWLTRVISHKGLLNGCVCLMIFYTQILSIWHYNIAMQFSKATVQISLRYNLPSQVECLQYNNRLHMTLCFINFSRHSIIVDIAHGTGFIILTQNNSQHCNTSYCWIYISQWTQHVKYQACITDKQ